MAGKRQHYVPRLLQRGFLHDPGEEAERTWLHRRGAKPSLVGIRDIGVEDWFYSRKAADGQPTLDDIITKMERDLGPIVDNLRTTPPGDEVNSNMAARCVVHLVMRTNHLRTVIASGFSSLTDEILSIFADPARLGTMFGLNSPELAPPVTEAIRDAALKLAPSGIPPAFTERLMSVLIRENGADLIRNAAVALPPIFGKLLSGVGSTVREAHNRTLANPPTDTAWLVKLSGFRWTIIAKDELILPDAVALATESDQRLVPFLFARAADVKGVLMPLSRNRMLAGVSANYGPIDLSDFNRQAAASSQTFFIGARSYDAESLASLIGSGPATAIRSAISEAVRGTDPSRIISSDIPAPSYNSTLEQSGFSYTVRLADFGDMTLAKELSDVIQSVVAEISRHIPLHDLDGFTIAMDYQGALAKLDRGDETLPPVTSHSLEYGVGVAIPISVKRDGVRKEHIVVGASIAHQWLSEDPKTRASALNILVKMLANVAHATRFAREIAISFTPDPMAAELHLAVAPTPPRWFSARESAFVAPHLGQAYVELVIESLEFAEQNIATERTKSYATGDISNVTQRALECVAAILMHVADWLGHRAGLPDNQSFEGDDLPARLQSRGLDKWLELFGRDLTAIYETPEVGLNLSVITKLSQHVERLLWAFGIYAWPDEDNIRCLVHEQRLIPPRFI